MSASLSWIAWCSAIGLPKVLRTCAYATDSMSAARATPTPRAATLMRPSSSPTAPCFMPRPSTPPTRLSFRNTVVIEHELGAVDALVAEFFELARMAEARALLANEQAHAAMARLRVRIGFDQHRKRGAVNAVC